MDNEGIESTEQQEVTLQQVTEPKKQKKKLQVDDNTRDFHNFIIGLHRKALNVDELYSYLKYSPTINLVSHYHSNEEFADENFKVIWKVRGNGVINTMKSSELMYILDNNKYLRDIILDRFSKGTDEGFTIEFTDIPHEVHFEYFKRRKEPEDIAGGLQKVSDNDIMRP